MDDVPPLEDFQEQLKMQIKKPPISSSEDYTKVNPRFVEDEAKQAELLQETQAHVKHIEQSIQQSKQQTNQKDKEYSGLKKGFFTNKSPPALPQLTGKKNEPLRIPEVQEAMKMNNYLNDTKKDWMTDGFLNQVESNGKIQKLFSNPEYMKAIDLFKTNPKEAMAKYGGNKEFMEGFQQFCLLMGTQFQSIAKK